MNFFLGQQPLVPLLLLGPPFFSDYSFRVHHLVNQDDRQLLAHAMASGLSVAWQCLSKRTIGFLLRIKFHASKYELCYNPFDHCQAIATFAFERTSPRKMKKKTASIPRYVNLSGLGQGCQIFLGTTYQNWKNIP
jgi:hypothetical protein